MQYDANAQNHIQSHIEGVESTTPLLTSTLNIIMSNGQQNRPQKQLLPGTTKLSEATNLSTACTSVPTASNVIQTNSKNTMLSSFVSVIEGTKDLSISDEKQRSPKHQHNSQRQGSSKTMSSPPKQHPLLESTNLNSVATKLPAAPTVITPQSPPPTIKSGKIHHNALKLKTICDIA